MKVILAAAAALFTTTLAGLIARDGDEIYEVQGLTIYKYDAQNISTVSFNVTETSGRLDSACYPHDPDTGGTVDSFQTDQIYSCGTSTTEEKYFSFKYVPSNATDPAQIWLYEDVTETLRLQGRAYVDDPPCSARNSTPKYIVCTASPETYYAIKLHEEQ